MELAYDEADLLGRMGPKSHDPGGKPLQLMSNVNGLAQLAACSTSMNWLAAQLTKLKHLQGFDATAQLVWDADILKTHEQLDTLIEACHGLADKCLIYLRTEIRHVTIVNCAVVAKTRRSFSERQVSFHDRAFLSHLLLPCVIRWKSIQIFPP